MAHSLFDTANLDPCCLPQFAFIAPTTSDGSKEGVHTPDRGPLEDIDRRAGVHIGQASDDAIGFVFRVGGVSALVAAWLCWQMRRRKK